MNGISENSAVDDHSGGNILIAGGGLAGLLCALECKRNGFSPTVVEAKPSVQSAGKFVYHHLTAIVNIHQATGSPLETVH